MIISVGEESDPSDDEMIEIHSNASQNGSENKSAHMSDITQTHINASDQNSQNKDDNSQNQDEEEEEENHNGNDPNLSPDNMNNDQVASPPLQDNPPMDLSLSNEKDCGTFKEILRTPSGTFYSMKHFSNPTSYQAIHPLPKRQIYPIQKKKGSKGSQIVLKFNISIHQQMKN
jgi:hypothetical protein